MTWARVCMLSIGHGGARTTRRVRTLRSGGGRIGRVVRRGELIRTLERFGCVLVRHGGKPDWYRNPATGMSQPVPRHREIKEGLARHIIKMWRHPADGSSGAESTETSSA